MKNLILYCISAFLIITQLNAQSFKVNFTVTPTGPRNAISPYIYGLNSGDYPNITARRQGGNRMTGYNWENNFSNAGNDYNMQSDNYLPWVMNIPTNQYLQPGIVATAFHDASLARHAYSLITLQMAGYVAIDGNGPVDIIETAPSDRWAAVINQKGSAFSLSPNTSDSVVYMDEFMNFLITKYGKASGGKGIRGYALDNEPGLWSSTHPRIHPDKTGVSELIARSVALATTVKNMDSTAEVFGPVLYGFNAYETLQDAPDWASHKYKYAWFVDCYLDSLSKASTAAGRRLLDAFDVHWYPEPTGVTGTDTSRSVIQTRLQITRSLWDSSYVEPTWIGQYYKPVAIIHHIQNSIKKYFPGTKLSISEYYYGADNHISGAVAESDVLGIFGKFNVYFGATWGDANNYVKSAFELYRNYDGHNATYGDLNVPATTDNISISSIYASVESTDSTKLHIIALNKNLDNACTGTFTINSAAQYKTGVVYGITGSSPNITKIGTIDTIAGNTLTYTIPPLSVYHIILSAPKATDVQVKSLAPATFALEQNYPNPFNPSTTINYSLAQDGKVSLRVYNILGKEVSVLVNKEQKAGIYTEKFDASSLPSGIYFYELRIDGKFLSVKKMIVAK